LRRCEARGDRDECEQQETSGDCAHGDLHISGSHACCQGHCTGVRQRSRRVIEDFGMRKPQRISRIATHRAFA